MFMYLPVCVSEPHLTSSSWASTVGYNLDTVLSMAPNAMTWRLHVWRRQIQITIRQICSQKPKPNSWPSSLIKVGVFIVFLVSTRSYQICTVSLPLPSAGTATFAGFPIPFDSLQPCFLEGISSALASHVRHLVAKFGCCNH